jgi:endonuclease YncB( thermonuclease family)
MKKFESDNSMTVLVTKIKDGDTYVAKLSNGKKITIRMEGIDSPEKKQEFGQESINYLKSLIEGRYVVIQVTGIDLYKRLLAFTYINPEKEVGFEMLTAGLAWHFSKYNHDETYAAAQLLAKDLHVGIFSKPNPVPPWEFRAKK